MPTIRLHETTTATPGQFVAGLTDFGPGRKELFANSADAQLRVVEGGQHFLSASDPDDVNTAVAEFIDRWR